MYVVTAAFCRLCGRFANVLPVPHFCAVSCAQDLSPAVPEKCPVLYANPADAVDVHKPHRDLKPTPTRVERVVSSAGSVSVSQRTHSSYNAVFQHHVDTIKQEGRYRIFADLERHVRRHFA
jgi:hypothetical protein